MQNQKLEGIYQIEEDYLKSEKLLLKVALRHRTKKGQAKRFIGVIDNGNEDSFNYISSLYPVKNKQNCYELESEGNYYLLNITSNSTAEINKKIKPKALVFNAEVGRA